MKKKLWATHFSYLNDYEEYNWLLRLIEIKIENCNLLHDEAKAHFLNKLLFQTRKVKDLSIPYIISFSRKGDQLSQWRAYANNGASVSIGFKFKPCIKFVSIKKKFKDLDNFIRNRYFACNVEYLDEDKDNFMSDFFDVAYNEFISIFPDLGIPELNTSNRIKYDGLLFRYARIISNCAIVCKHFGFKEEKETRIIYRAPISYTNMQYLDENFVKDTLKHRTNETSIVPYLELDTNENLVIKEIILGPKYSGQQTDIEDFLKANVPNSDNIDIKRSSIPYI